MNTQSNMTLAHSFWCLFKTTNLIFYHSNMGHVQLRGLTTQDPHFLGILTGRKSNTWCYAQILYHFVMTLVRMLYLMKQLPNMI